MDEATGRDPSRRGTAVGRTWRKPPQTVGGAAREPLVPCHSIVVQRPVSFSRLFVSRESQKGIFNMSTEDEVRTNQLVATFPFFSGGRELGSVLLPSSRRFGS